MSIVEKINKIENLFKSKNGKATDEQIKFAENKLGLKFSEEYKEYVKEFGMISFGSNEWTGLNIEGYFNVVNMTEEERELNPSLPKDYFIIENLAIDGIVIVSNEEGKIYSVSYNQKEFLCNSLSEYLDICLKN